MLRHCHRQGFPSATTGEIREISFECQKCWSKIWGSAHVQLARAQRHKSFKNQSRRLASLRKIEDFRGGIGLYLSESDIQHFSNDSLDVLNDIMDL